MASGTIVNIDTERIIAAVANDDFREFAKLTLLDSVRIRDIKFCNSPLFPLYADAVFPGCDIERAKIAWESYLEK